MKNDFKVLILFGLLLVYFVNVFHLLYLINIDKWPLYCNIPFGIIFLIGFIATSAFLVVKYCLIFDIPLRDNLNI